MADQLLEPLAGSGLRFDFDSEQVAASKKACMSIIATFAAEHLDAGESVVKADGSYLSATAMLPCICRPERRCLGLIYLTPLSRTFNPALASPLEGPHPWAWDGQGLLYILLDPSSWFFA
ncbi:MAG: hypothetical protein Q9173_002676 [Seirophora scorigena]